LKGGRWLDGQMIGTDAAVLSVTQLTREIRCLLEEQIGTVWVEGEISNLRRQASGHQYFTLKDAGAQLSCVMFRGVAQRVPVRLADGVAVRVQGEISVYEPRGSYQLVVRQVEAQGQGSLQAKFEALKLRLQEEGLFDQQFKQAIPKFPLTVALVTSPTGAAIRDMLNILERRAPWVRVMVYPVRVQGQGAEQEIAMAIRQLNQAELLGLPVADTIVVGRGGGSLEDLWNFNEEVVARAIFASTIPVISAVGHEIDFTIADFVADLRAPTPSAAAELLAPDRAELSRHLEAVSRRLRTRMQTVIERQEQVLKLLQRGSLAHEPERRMREAAQQVDEVEVQLRELVRERLQTAREELTLLEQALTRLHPLNLLSETRHRVDLLEQRLGQVVKRRMERLADRVAAGEASLRMLGPSSVLARGFSYTLNAAGKVVSSAEELAEGEMIRTQLAKGIVESRVSGVLR
jgi:exodeoxyribonuclease VII large subunit